MATFNHIQPMMNSFDNTIDDQFFDSKPYFPESFLSCNSNSLPSGTHQTSSNRLITSKHDEVNNMNWSFQATAEFTSCPQLISFGKSSSSSVPVSDILSDDMTCNRTSSTTRSPSQAQYHVVAERKRREKLSQLFISLSKIVPGLKKLDKASLLGDAIKYMKELEERVKTLEEEMAKRNSVEFDARETISTYANDISSIKRNSIGSIRESIPHIRVRISNNNLLIKIHCKKQSGLARIPREMEKLHLTILDIRVIPFDYRSLDITILAEKDTEFSTTVEDIIKHLQIAISSP